MRCAYGNCNSDSRYKHKEHMKGVSFIPFPKPKSNLQRCKAWIACCGRKEVELNISNITKNSYVCSKHFRVSIGPTAQFPDPIPFSQENEKNMSEWKGAAKKEIIQNSEFAHNPPNFEKTSSISVENKRFETTETPLPLSDDNNTYVVFEDSDKPKLAYSNNIIEVSDEDDNGYSPKSEKIVNLTENEIIQNPDVTVWAEDDAESQLDSREEYYNDYTHSDSNDVPLSNFNDQDTLPEQENSKIKYKTSEQSTNERNTMRTFSEIQNVCQTRGFHKIRYCLGADRICEDGTHVPRLVYKCEFCGQTYEAKGDDNSSSF